MGRLLLKGQNKKLKYNHDIVTTFVATSMGNGINHVDLDVVQAVKRKNFGQVQAIGTQLLMLDAQNLYVCSFNFTAKSVSAK